MIKKTFYRVVSDEFPGGIISQSKHDAQEWAEMERENGEKAYFRKIKMTQKEFNDLNELDY